MKRIRKAFLAASVLLFGAAMLCSCGSEAGSAAQTEDESSYLDIDIQSGNYYLNGDSSSRCIAVSSDDQTFQFTNCDLAEYVRGTLLFREEFDSDESYQNVCDSVLRTISAPVIYHGIDPELNRGRNVFIRINDFADYEMTMKFQYVSDSQGTSLIFGTGDNLQEYILEADKTE